MGGEKDKTTGDFKTIWGSPPRGRGKVACKALGIGADGITPAWAGKSLKQPFARIGPTDHPRVGGEKVVKQGADWFVGGSPPRGRGKVKSGLKDMTTLRITPAWAGKRAGKDDKQCRKKDHPRVGGEKTKKIP